MVIELLVSYGAPNAFQWAMLAHLLSTEVKKLLYRLSVKCFQPDKTFSFFHFGASIIDTWIFSVAFCSIPDLKIKDF